MEGFCITCKHAEATYRSSNRFAPCSMIVFCHHFKAELTEKCGEDCDGYEEGSMSKEVSLQIYVVYQEGAYGTASLHKAFFSREEAEKFKNSIWHSLGSQVQIACLDLVGEIQVHCERG